MKIIKKTTTISFVITEEFKDFINLNSRFFTSRSQAINFYLLVGISYINNNKVDLDYIINHLKQNLTHRNASSKIPLGNQPKCPFCKNIVDLNSFKDDLSKKEFNISGLCQKCQDEFFDGDI